MGFEKIIEFEPYAKERSPRIRSTLLEMLSYRRPNGSKTEKKFIRKFLSPLQMQIDGFGNHYKRIGDAPILWSCHTDTVHKFGGRQLTRVSEGEVFTVDPQSNCLGADCTAGVWLMTQMIEAQVPGLYVFHRAEEVGGLGSAWIAETTPDLLEDIKYAIAFDRRGTKSIITHQWGGRCCSKSFALSLSDAIGLEHKMDSGGSFTDTASYVDLIGECTNVSVGYEGEHSKGESLDLEYIERLRDALVQADFTKLVSERKPGEIDKEDMWETYSKAYGYGNNWRQHGVYSDTNKYVPSSGLYDDDQEATGTTGFRKSGYSLYALVRDNPAEVADWLEEYGISIEDLEEALYMRGCVLRTN